MENGNGFLDDFGNYTTSGGFPLLLILKSYLTIFYHLAIIGLTSVVDVLLRPVVRLLCRLSPHRPLTGALFRRTSNERLRVKCRQALLETIYKVVLACVRWLDARDPLLSYDRNVVYLPTIKVQISSPEVNTCDPDCDLPSYFEAWAVFQDANLFHSYISEPLAQQMKLPLHPAKWDPNVSVVNLSIKPLNLEVGIPLDAPEKPDPEDLIQLVVLPLEQFGRIDIRIPSAPVEDLAEDLDVDAVAPLPPLNDCDLFCQPTADVIIGQQLYLSHFVPPAATQRTFGPLGGVTFTAAVPYGAVLTGGKRGGMYGSYSSERVLWLYPIVCIVSIATLVPLYSFVVHCSLLHLHILSPTVQLTILKSHLSLVSFFLLLTLCRFLVDLVPRFRELRPANVFRHILDQLVLRLVYWVLDLEVTLPHLVDKECYQFGQMWFRWVKKMIADNQLVPRLKATWSSGPRSVRFSDQNEFLPEESRAEMHLAREHYRPVLCVRQCLVPSRRIGPEIRILLNAHVDHSIITERAVRRLGLKKRLIWPRFYYGYYPKADDMSCFTQMTDLFVIPKEAPKGPSRHRPTHLFLLVSNRELTADRPVPLATQEELKANYNYELSDTPQESTTRQHIDIVIGQDQLNRHFFVGHGRIRPVTLTNFETAFTRETRWGRVFEGFVKQEDKGAKDGDEQRGFLENLWSSLGGSAK